MVMLELKKAANKLAKANGVRWYGHVLRQPEENVLIKTMVHEVGGKCGVPTENKTEGTNMKRIGLRKEAAWSSG